MDYKKYLKRDSKTSNFFEGVYVFFSNNKGKKNPKSFIFIFLFYAILIFGIFFVAFQNPNFTGRATSSEEGYIELLVKTSDNIISKSPKNEWTPEMFIDDRKSIGKQGYIVLFKPEGWKWGKKELDPKRFAIIKIPASQWNEQWLEPEYDSEGNILTDKKYRISLESFLSEEELEYLKSIPYNDDSDREPIIKTIENIAELIEEVDWEKRPADMVLHGSSGLFTICEAGAPTCDYSTLSSWNDGEESDIRGSGPAIANITGAWVNPDTATVLLDGWSTDSDNYILITTDADNKAVKTGWDTSKYRLVVTNAVAINQQEDYFFIDGLQLRVNNTADYPYIFQNSAGSAATTNVTNCYFTSSSSGGAVTAMLLSVAAASEYNLYNNVFYNFKFDGLKIVTGNAMIYNNVFFNITEDAIEYDAGTTGSAINNVVFNSGDDIDIDVAATVTVDYCATDDGDGTNVVSPFGADWANEYPNYLPGDFTLISGGNLEDGGYDLSAIFVLDIDGETRSGTWDVGPDEIVSGDTINPELNITHPINNTNTTNIGYDVNFTASDETLLDSCWYTNDTNLVNKSLGSAGVCTNISNLTWSEGTHNVTVWINDSSNNLNKSIIFFTIDLTSPAINISYPQQNLTNSSNIGYDVNFTALDSITILDSCWYTNDTNLVNKSLGSAGVCTNISNLTWSEGLHNITIWVNDTINNINQSTISFTIDTIAPSFINIKNLSFMNNTAWGYDFDAEATGMIVDCFSVNDTVNFEINCSGWINTTSLDLGTYYVNVTINDTLNNLNSTILKIKSVQINYTNFTGVTTNFFAVEDLSNVSELTLENPEYGKLNFTENVNLENGTNFNFVNISFNRIELNSSLAPSLNKSSKLYLYNLTFSNPRILRDGSVCPSTICVRESYSGGILVFNVSHFTIYSAAETPSTTTPSTGSSGGGTATKVKQAKFKTNYEFYEKTVSVNSVNFGELVIENTDKFKRNYELKVQTIGNLITFDETEFSLEPNELKSIGFKISAPFEPGLYVGKLIISSGSESKYIPVSLNIRSEKNLFDIVVIIPDEMKIISKGEVISSQINLLEMGLKEMIDVTLLYKIKDFTGKIYLEESETIAVYDQKDLYKEFNVEALSPGDYVLGVELIYPNGVAVASSQFKIKEDVFEPFGFDLDKMVLIAISVGVILIFVVTFFGINKYNSLTKKLKTKLKKNKFETYKK